MSILHIYSPGQWHDESCIADNKPGLLYLRKAIDNALKYGEGQNHSFTSDGFVFHVLNITKQIWIKFNCLMRVRQVENILVNSFEGLRLTFGLNTYFWR